MLKTMPIYSSSAKVRNMPLFTEMPEGLYTKVKSILIFRTQISLAYICKNILFVMWETGYETYEATERIRQRYY